MIKNKKIKMKKCKIKLKKYLLKIPGQKNFKIYNNKNQIHKKIKYNSFKLFHNQFNKKRNPNKINKKLKQNKNILLPNN